MNAILESAYAALGLPSFATYSQVKGQYRQLALKCHPDKVQGNETVKKAAHDAFAKISAAYELLTAHDKYNLLALEAEGPIICGPTNFTDPYQLFRQNFGYDLGGVSFVKTSDGAAVAGYLTNERDSVSRATVQPKRSYQEIFPPSSPVTTATYDYDTAPPSSKRIKTVHISPPQTFEVRRSVKRDSSWSSPSSTENPSSSSSFDSYSQPTTKRMRMTSSSPIYCA